MVSNVTMETEVVYETYTDASDIALLNNLREVGELVLYKTSC
jgi:hypothetical protein